ncbi:metallophosphoesterase [Paraburkholderia aspalathi]|nr:metallophosphoesterase [Paraburkholderia aspalathi]
MQSAWQRKRKSSFRLEKGRHDLRLWTWSDLHLDQQSVEWPEKLPSAVDIIVITGDLCHASNLSEIAYEIIKRYRRPIILVPGNHEFYSSFGGRTLEADRQRMQEISIHSSRNWPEILHVMDDNCIHYKGVRFVGGTLWTDMKMGASGDVDLAWRMLEAQSLTSDFERINVRDGEGFTPAEMVRLHNECRELIESTLSTPFEGKTIVLSHHLPHPAATPEIYVGEAANYLFASGEEAFESIMHSDDAPHLWVCGHTHHTVDVTVGNTRIISNPHGFHASPDERANGFRWDLVIDTDDL